VRVHTVRLRQRYALNRSPSNDTIALPLRFGEWTECTTTDWRAVRRLRTSAVAIQ